MRFALVGTGCARIQSQQSGSRYALKGCSIPFLGRTAHFPARSPQLHAIGSRICASRSHLTPPIPISAPPDPDLRRRFPGNYAARTANSAKTQPIPLSCKAEIGANSLLCALEFPVPGSTKKATASLDGSTFQRVKTHIQRQRAAIHAKVSIDQGITGKRPVITVVPTPPSLIEF